MLWVLLVGSLLGCSEAEADDNTGAGPTASAGTADGDGPSTAETTAAEPAPGTTPSSATPVIVRGQVVTGAGREPLPGARLTAGGSAVVTGPDGLFELAVQGDGPVEVARPGWQPVEVDPPGDGEELTVELEPLVVRGIRVSRTVAADAGRYRNLLDMADASTVNALVFDTKDETGTVLYDTGVTKAAELDAIRPVYDPGELLAEATPRGLYAITRIVTFEDEVWAGRDAEAKLAGAWVDATDQANWAYPLDLAVEACELGFDEIQFDYVRYPAGRTASAVAGRIPGTSDERSAVIAAFLEEARTRLAPMGCGVSAAVFGIVVSSPSDEGIGQLVEAVSPSVDVLSPMIYPSHYNPGWMGFPDPNDHPGPVVARALDDGMARLGPTTLMRPWIQAFYYNGEQIGAEIQEAEQRGAGWILWNAGGDYRLDWLPTD